MSPFVEVFLLFKVVTEETSILRRVIHSFLYSSNSWRPKEPVSYKSSSQYSLSLHSFKAISNLDIKSFVLCAYCASWTLAPMEVPHRKSCWSNTPSAPCCFSFRQRNIIFLANAFDVFLKMLSAITYSFNNGEANHNCSAWCTRSYEFGFAKCFDAINRNDELATQVLWYDRRFLQLCRRHIITWRSQS